VTDMSFDKLWQDHLQNPAEVTLLLTTSSQPGNEGVVNLEGGEVKEFKQKPEESDNYIIFSCAFIAEPVVFNYEGHSLERDSFSYITDSGSLYGHISSGDRVHIAKG